MYRMLVCMVMLIVVANGCQPAEDPQVIESRQKYTFNSEPAGALGVIDVREKIDGDQTFTEPVVLIGRVGTDAHQTWEPGKAAFVVVDPTAEMPAHDHGPGHNHDNCPFCKAEAAKVADASALVRVIDEQGEVVSIDARKLFKISSGQLVVVRGMASLDAVGNLTVAAEGIYPRR